MPENGKLYVAWLLGVWLYDPTFKSRQVKIYFSFIEQPNRPCSPPSLISSG